jgi:uncharacterized membrane protein
MDKTMTRLAFGVLLWSIVHLFPAVAADLKKNLIDRMGEYPYKGVFTLLLVFSLYLIISGWGLTVPEQIFYAAPDWGGYVAGLLVFIGFILFFAPYPPNNLKRILRHPQLIGTVFWGVGHLLAIGSPRSMLLFGGLTAWALAEILLINRRDDEWIKPDKVPHLKDFSLVLFSVLIYAVFLFTHHLMFGGDPLT